jgi:hypothetical protein
MTPEIELYAEASEKEFGNNFRPSLKLLLHSMLQSSEGGGNGYIVNDLNIHTRVFLCFLLYRVIQKYWHTHKRGRILAIRWQNELSCS